MAIQNDRNSINQWMDRVSNQWQKGLMDDSTLREEISNLEKAVDDLRVHIPTQDNYKPEESRIRYFKYQLSWTNPTHQMQSIGNFFANLTKVIGSIFR